MVAVALDHVNLRTARLSEMVRFYVDVLGLRSGPRPPFDFNGAWMYVGDHPIVHLVEVDDTAVSPPTATQGLHLEHFALRGRGLAAFLARLRELGIAYEHKHLPGAGTHQVFLRDPDQNRLHVDFAANETGEKDDDG